MPQHPLGVVGPDQDVRRPADPVHDRAELDLTGLAHRAGVERGDLGHRRVVGAHEPGGVPGLRDVHGVAVDVVPHQPGAVVHEVLADRADQDRAQAEVAQAEAMLAAQPPRRTSRSSTRNDSAILSSWSTTSESANLPGNDIRWSVAMEPVTSNDTGASSGVGELNRRQRDTTGRYRRDTPW